jgi:hypothetical protein
MGLHPEVPQPSRLEVSWTSKRQAASTCSSTCLCSSETSVNFNKTTRRQIPGDSKGQVRRICWITGEAEQHRPAVRRNLQSDRAGSPWGQGRGVILGNLVLLFSWLEFRLVPMTVSGGQQLEAGVGKCFGWRTLDKYCCRYCWHYCCVVVISSPTMKSL